VASMHHNESVQCRRYCPGLPVQKYLCIALLTSIGTFAQLGPFVANGVTIENRPAEPAPDCFGGVHVYINNHTKVNKIVVYRDVMVAKKDNKRESRDSNPGNFSPGASFIGCSADRDYSHTYTLVSVRDQ
jgi:hypothetical protein